MRRRAIAILILMTTIGPPGISYANEPRRHEPEVFLRMSGGPGIARLQQDRPVGSPDDPLDASEACIDVSFAVGATVTENLAIHGTFGGWRMIDPAFGTGRANAGAEDSPPDDEAALLQFGGGLTYYFMPVNIYVTGSLAASWPCRLASAMLV